jgi:ABC-type lipoprotein export system ATPase subunit
MPMSAPRPDPAADGAQNGSNRGLLIEAREVTRHFDGGRVQALGGVSFAIRDGEFVAVVGPSGSGKSTLLQILGTLDAPTSGSLSFRGQPVPAIRDLSGFRARTIGFIFQSFHLLPTLTAIENVQIPMFEMPWRSHARRRRAAELLEAVGLGERLDHLPAQLSGGERQRVAVARSLANEPQLLLADEPTGNLDSASAQRTMELIGDIHRRHGMSLIIVTHNPEVAACAGRTLRMLDGRIVSDTLKAGGTP